VKPPLFSILSWAAALLIPLFLLGFSVRLLLTPLFLQIEYRLPGFPADEYGFTTQERLRWGSYGIRYLLNDANISYLGDLKFSDGKPLFNERELSHMQDVKRVTQGFLRLWLLDLTLLLLLGLWSWRGGWASAYRQGLRRGGWLTLGLALTIGGVAALGALGMDEAFWAFFSGFHALFFEGETWLFAYSDTLIRLYPIKFWQDTVLYIGLLVSSSALALIRALRPAKA